MDSQRLIVYWERKTKMVNIFKVFFLYTTTCLYNNPFVLFTGLSKSKSDLSRSMTNLNSSQNQIVQLPVLNNAPFEQTFRITVCMPHDQLYVARLGAKTNLSKLLEMVCQDKDLDRDKYEFRHPGKFFFYYYFV